MTDDIGEMDVKKKKGLLHDIKINKAYYLMLLPVLILFYRVFLYPYGGTGNSLSEFPAGKRNSRKQLCGLKKFHRFF